MDCFLFDNLFSSKKYSEAEIEVGANLIGMVKKKPKYYTSILFRILQRIVQKVLTSCWGESIWYLGTDRQLILATSITCRRLYLLLLHTTKGEKRHVLPFYLIILTILLRLPFGLFPIPFSCLSSLEKSMRFTTKTNQGSLTWRWRSSGLLIVVGYGYILQLLWGWLSLNFLSYGVKRDHYDKFIGIREFLEILALDCFKKPFSNDTRTLENNIPPLDEVNEGQTVSTCLVLHFSSSISPSAAASTIFNITLNSASLIYYTLVTCTIGSQHTAEI